jgi:hypothetical protein
VLSQLGPADETAYPEEGPDTWVYRTTSYKLNDMSLIIDFNRHGNIENLKWIPSLGIGVSP